MFTFRKGLQLVHTVKNRFPVLFGYHLHLLTGTIMPNNFIHEEYITYYNFLSIDKITFDNIVQGLFFEAYRSDEVQVRRLIPKRS